MLGNRPCEVRACVDKYEDSRDHVKGLYPAVEVLTDSDAVLAHLSEHGISAGIHYVKPLPLLKAYNHPGHKLGDFSVVNWISMRSVRCW